MTLDKVFSQSSERVTLGDVSACKTLAYTPENLPEHERIQPCQLAAFTHPERDFQVFSTPDVHACVIGANLLKIISVYREQAACHSRSPAERDKPRARLVSVTSSLFSKRSLSIHISHQFYISPRSLQSSCFFPLLLTFFSAVVTVVSPFNDLYSDLFLTLSPFLTQLFLPLHNLLPIFLFV